MKVEHTHEPGEMGQSAEEGEEERLEEKTGFKSQWPLGVSGGVEFLSPESAGGTGA